MTKKEFDFGSERGIHRMEMQSITGVIPEGTSPIARIGINSVLLSATHIERRIPLLFENQSQISQAQAQSFYLALSEMAILPADHPGLEGAYKKLTEVLVAEEAPVTAKYSAIIISDALMHQAALPLEEKMIFQKMKRIRGADKNGQLTAMKECSDVLEQQPTTKSSQKAFADMVDVHEAYLSALEEEATQMPETKEDHAQRLKDLQATTELGGTILYSMLQVNCSPDVRARLDTLYMESVTPLFIGENVEALLLDGKIEDIYPAFRFLIWKQAMWKEHGFGMTLDNDSQSKLGTYFLTHPPVQEMYWIALEQKREAVKGVPHWKDTIPETMNNVPYSYLETEWFFLQDENTLRSFFQTFPREGKTTKEDYNRFTNLLGFVGTFQTLYPEHKNIPVLQTAIAEIVKEKRMTKKVSTAMAILTDREPGIITLKSHGIDVTSQMHGQELTDILPKEASLLYQSKAEVPKAKIKQKEHAKPVQQKELPQEPLLVIASGENYFVPYWHEVQTPYPEDVARMLTHLDEQIHKQNPSEDTLLDLATQDVSAKPKHDRAVVLPSFLDADHPLSSLGDAGIVGVQRSGDSFLFVIDAKHAGISVEGSGRIVLTGEMDTDHELHLTNAPNNFEGSHLHLALSGAAVLSYQSAPEEMKMGRKVADRVARVKEKVVEWNRAASPEGYPGIENTTPDSETETGIVFPVTQTDVVLLTLRD